MNKNNEINKDNNLIMNELDFDDLEKVTGGNASPYQGNIIADSADQYLSDLLKPVNDIFHK